MPSAKDLVSAAAGKVASAVGALPSKSKQVKDPKTGLPVDAVTGKPLVVKNPAGQTVDAVTGKPVKVDPVSGKTVDAATGEPLTVRDPISGQVVDAASGNPVKRDPVSGKIVVVEESPDLSAATAKLGTKSTKETESQQVVAGPVEEDDDDNDE